MHIQLSLTKLPFCLFFFLLPYFLKKHFAISRRKLTNSQPWTGHQDAYSHTFFFNLIQQTQQFHNPGSSTSNAHFCRKSPQLEWNWLGKPGQGCHIPQAEAEIWRSAFWKRNTLDVMGQLAKGVWRWLEAYRRESRSVSPREPNLSWNLRWSSRASARNYRALRFLES